MIIENLKNLRRDRELKKWFKRVHAYDLAIAIHEDAIEVEDACGVTCAVSVWDGAKIIGGISHDPKGHLDSGQAST